MKPRLAVAATLAVSALALAACSSSDDSGSSPTPSASPTTASSTPSTTPSSTAGTSSSTATGAEGGLAAIVVQSSDVPSTYKAAPAEKNDDSDTALLACIGAKSTKADEKATVQSKDFSSGPVSVSSQATRYGSQASVDADSAIFRSAKTKSCLTAELKKKLASDPSVGTVVSVDVNVTPGTNGGPSNVAATTTAKIVAASGGKQVTVYIDSVYITGPKLEVEIDFTGVGAQADSTLATSVASAVAKRAAAA